jgi:nitrate/TMAO reductase-like tetraheme cytochrome c subunit
VAFFKRTQKSAMQRLAGNLDYYNRPNGWRRLRFWLIALTLLTGLAAAPAYYYLHGSPSVMSPGPISRAHASFAQNCAACHVQTAMIKADSHAAGRIVREEYYVPLDQACGDCHKHFAFHEPDVVPDLKRTAGTGAQNENSSCTSCHREHLTAGRMPPAQDFNCAACHARADLMAASAQAAHRFPPNAFPVPHPGGLLYFYKPHPRDGYTQAFAAFDHGHPEFQIKTAHLKDPDTLQYNHARHEQADIPNTEMGTRLDCKYCHKPDASGMFFQKISFEANCVHCHALAFDPNTPPGNDANDPGLLIPHGDPEKVEGYLRSLPYQYLEYAKKRNGLIGAQAQTYMRAAIDKLADSYGVAHNALEQLGPKLEQKVFYSADHVPTGVGAMQRRAQGRTQETTFFPGCAFCHQVSAPAPNLTPVITKAVIFDRWLGDGNFNHAKHQQQTCAECHSSIHTSQLTSDINIPSQRSCIVCHNSKPGGVANDCLSCHHYHNDPRQQTIDPLNQHQHLTAASADFDGHRPPLHPGQGASGL